MHDAVDEFFGRLTAILGSPSTVEPAAFKAVYRQQLERFSPDVLRQAADNLFAEWTYKRWPTPAELRGYAEGVLELSRPRRASRNLWADAENMMLDWFRERPDPDLINTAEYEGWTEDLQQVVRCTAHACLVRDIQGAPVPEPWQQWVRVPQDWRVYYRKKRASYAAGAEWRAEQRKLHPSPGRLGKGNLQPLAALAGTQCAPGAAIRAHIERTHP